MTLAKENKEIRNIRAVKMPWGDTIFTFLWRGRPHVFAKDISDKLGLNWEMEERTITNSKTLEYALVSVQEIGLDSDDDNKYIAFNLENLHGYLFGIPEYQIEDEHVQTLLVVYKRECMKVLDNYWRFGVAINPAFVLNNRCKQMADEGELSFEPQVDIEMYANFMRVITGALVQTCLPADNLKLAVEAADSAKLAGLNDVMAFIKVLRPLSPASLQVHTTISRMLQAINDSNFCEYVSDHLAAYVCNQVVQVYRNNLFRNIRVELRTEAQRETIVFTILETMIADFLMDMLGPDAFMEMMGNAEQAA